MPDPKIQPRVKRPPLKAVDIARENTPKSWRAWFAEFARHCSNAVGSPVVFLLALGIVLAWGITGPMFHFSDTWQLIINTGTTIVTFLMVFLIQSTQNRDAKAIHFKLDELIHAVHGAHEELIDVEDLTDEELDELAEHYHRVRAERAGKRASGQAAPDDRSKTAAPAKNNGKSTEPAA
jgi:low affinity Fe/Cu permease